MTADLKGIIFDKDGTLFDFDATWGVATAEMIAVECEGDSARMDALADTLLFDLPNTRFFPGSPVIASTSDVVIDLILPHTRDNNRDALAARMVAVTSDVPQIAVTDLPLVFADLRARGLALGIATNDSEAPARSNIAQANVLDMFAFIAGHDSGFGSKPATGQLDAFCAHTGIAPHACAMVGDSLHDLHAGRDAGMVCVGVLTGPASRADLTPHADVVLSSIAELPAWLDTRAG